MGMSRSSFGRTLTSKTCILFSLPYEAIPLAENRTDEHSSKFDGQNLYLERRILTISVWFEANVRLTSTDDATEENQEVLDDDQPFPSLGAIVSFLPASGNDEGD